MVYSYQLIKLELLTPSIRQQKLPPRHAVFGIRPGCPCGLGSHAASGRILLRKTLMQTELYFPIEMLYFSKVRQRCQCVILNKIKVPRFRNAVCFSELALARYVDAVYNNLNPCAMKLRVQQKGVLLHVMLANKHYMDAYCTAGNHLMFPNIKWRAMPACFCISKSVSGGIR